MNDQDATRAAGGSAPACSQSLMYARCNGCGETLGALMCLALMSDAGARCSPSPTYCPSTENHEHDFTANKGATFGAGGDVR